MHNRTGLAVAGSDAGACTYTPSAFQCHTLASLPGGYDASGVRLGNGCANAGTIVSGTVVASGTESWCHVPARPGATCTLCAQQGWERDCDHLCTEAAPDAARRAAASNRRSYKCHVPDKTPAPAKELNLFAVAVIVGILVLLCCFFVVREISSVDAEQDIESSARSENPVATPRPLNYDNVYDELDTDGSGEISLKELTGTLGRLGLRVSPQYIEGVWAVYDVDGNGELNRDEFRRLMAVLEAKDSE